MRQAPFELRVQARICLRAAEQETVPELKRQHAARAFVLAQLAEQLDLDRFVIEANIERYERILIDALGESQRRLVEKLLREERDKVAPAWAPDGQFDWDQLDPARAAYFDGLVDEAIAVTGADMGNLQLVDTTGALRIAASRGFDIPFLAFFAVVHGNDFSACGTALKEADRIVVPDVERSPIFAGQRSGDVLREAGVRAVQSTPLRGRAGNLVGMISTHWHSAWVPNDDRLKRLDSMIGRAASEIGAGA